VALRLAVPPPLWPKSLQRGSVKLEILRASARDAAGWASQLGDRFHREVRCPERDGESDNAPRAFSGDRGAPSRNPRGPGGNCPGNPRDAAAGTAQGTLAMRRRELPREPSRCGGGNCPGNPRDAAGPPVEFSRRDGTRWTTNPRGVFPVIGETCGYGPEMWCDGRQWASLTKGWVD
jgi:hypothetical protein